MIVVIGEALVDLVFRRDGTFTAALGGAPFNAARAASRLGASVTFAGGLSVDRFGGLLADQLTADGVRILDAARTVLPTTLAVAELDDTGSATYRFYLDGTSVPGLDPAVVAPSAAADVTFTGGLALAVLPVADVVVSHVGALSPASMLIVDVNARPSLIVDRPAYLARLGAVCERADLVKVSDDDLAVLAPDLDVAGILDRGATAVVVTAGSSPTRIVHRSGSRTVEVPVITAPIVDTIGAGDTFIGALMASWTTAGLGRADLDGPAGLDRLVVAVEAGHAAAAVVVTRPGADPPTRADLPAASAPPVPDRS